MLADLIKSLFPSQRRRAIALFFASFFLTVGIAACAGGGDTDVKSQANVTAEDIATPAPVGTTLNQILKVGQVEIAVPNDFPPFGFVGTDMNPRGYDIDVAQEIAKGLGVKLELESVVGNYRIPFLQTDRVDLIVSSLGKNEERDQIIDFSEAYAPFFSGIYGEPEIKVASMEDLQGHSVGVAQGSLEDLEVSKLPKGTVDIKRFANNSLTASALVSGQVELIATANAVAAKLIKDNPEAQIEKKFIMKDSPCYVGVREGDAALLEQVNAIIADLKQSGRLNELCLKWFGEPLPPSMTTT